jgi:hypothetical protein
VEGRKRLKVFKLKTSERNIRIPYHLSGVRKMFSRLPKAREG